MKIKATYDGEVFRPAEPVSLAPNTEVQISLQREDDHGGKGKSFLDTARSLDLNGPQDWVEKLDAYLYGGGGR